MSSFDLKSLNLGDVQTTGKGAKSCNFTSDGGAVWWTPGEALQVAFEPSAFGQEDATRVNLVFKLTPAVVEQLDALDAFVLERLVASSVAIFGKPLTEAEVKMRYTPCVKTSDQGYAPTLKCKINLTGRGAVRLWDMEKQVRKAPEAWIACRAVPRLQLRSLWLMAKGCGLLFECSDVQLDETPTECPF